MRLRNALLASAALLAACATPAPEGATDRAPAAAVDIAALEDPAALIDAGVQYNDLGRHDRAERAFRRALLLRETEWGVDDPQLVPLLTRMGIELSAQGRFREADLTFQRAERLAAENPADRARLMTAQAAHLAQKGELDAAFDRIGEAKALRRGLLKTGADEARGLGVDPLSATADDLADMANGLFVEAVIAERLGLFDEAKLAANLARRIVPETDLAPDWWIAPIDEVLALIEAREQGLDSAQRRLEQALVTRRWALGETRPTARTMLMLGRVYGAQGANDEAVAAMRRALEIVRDEKPDMQGVSTDEIVGFLNVAHTMEAGDDAAAADVRAEMFTAVQLGREGVTARTIARTAARMSAGDDAVAELIRAVQLAAQRRNQLRVALGRESATPAGQRTPGRLETLRDGFLAARAEAERLQADLDARFPEYRQLVASRPVAIAEIAGLLAADEAVAQFVIGDEGGFLFLIRGGSDLRVFRLDIDRPRVEDSVMRLLEAFDVSDGSIDRFNGPLAHDLYTRLFGDAEEALSGVEHLVVAPGGALLSFPFGLLLRGPVQPGSEAYGQMPWLALDMTISTVPSLRAFADLRGAVSASQAPYAFAGFGDPGFTGGTGGLGELAAHCRADRPTPPALIRSLTPLPDTRAEVIQVAQVLAGQGDTATWTGREVTESLVRSRRLEDYRILYFATHGLLPGELACQAEPALAFTPPASAANDFARDGLLDASEIAGLSLDADLVVLSACNTGGGSGDFGGESLSGLARSFFYAGARSLLVSHWQVESRATRILMVDVFRQYAAASGRLGVSEALRNAQRAMIATPATAHPFFWGAFTLVGDGGGQSTRAQQAQAR